MMHTNDGQVTPKTQQITTFISGLPSRLHEINALMTLALSALYDGKHRNATLEVLTLASSKLEDLECDAVDTAEGVAA